MKPLVFLTALVTALPAVAKDVYKIDPSSSSVSWAARKIGGSHNGTLAVKSGEVWFEGENLKGGEFVVDMTSIKVLDLTDPKYNGDLTTHLKSDDFFSVAKHGEAKFTAKSVTKKGDGQWEAKGPLTIKGISNDVTVPLKAEKKGGALSLSGKAKVDRTKYDIKFRSGKFFPQIGDKLIYDDFDIEVAFKAKK